MPPSDDKACLLRLRERLSGCRRRRPVWLSVGFPERYDADAASGQYDRYDNKDDKE
jgi:hypothetical protein